MIHTIKWLGTPNWDLTSHRGSSMKALRSGLFFLGLTGAHLLFMVPGRAHHSFVAHYDLDREIRLEAIVTSYQFRNPHVLIYFEAVNESGELEEWVAETNSPSLFRRRARGLTGDSLKPGDTITIAGYPSRHNHNDIHVNLIIFPDGEEFRSGNAQAQGR